jgi:hypothetical protein
MRTLKLIAASALIVAACASDPPQKSDSQICTEAGFGRDSAQFWQCMQYTQNQRALTIQQNAAAAQDKAARIAGWNAIRPRTCYGSGRSVTCY